MAKLSPAYDEERRRVSGGLAKNGEHGADPATVAKTVLRAATDPNPKVRYPVGSAQTLSLLRKLVPAGAFGRTLRKQFALDS